MNPRIRAVEIRNHPRLPDHTIDLGDHQHLILTGPNGSGKTTVLSQMTHEAEQNLGGTHTERVLDTNKSSLQATLERNPEHVGRGAWLRNLSQVKESIQKPRVNLVWSVDPQDCGAFLLAHHRADRSQGFAKPQGPSQLLVDPRGRRSFTSEFLQLLVNRHTTLLLRRGKGDGSANALERELTALRDGLRYLFDEPTLDFGFDDTAFTVDVLVDGKPLPWDALAAGHSALLQLVGDLYTRLQVGGLPHDAPGVVLIDEPELHLHPGLQERVLPGLTTLFPSLQLIVATHCAPVISSIDNAWIHDLRSQTGISSSALQGRPYGSILRSHFRVPTDYDRATTQRVEDVLQRAQTVKEHADKVALRDALEPLLGTDDTRVLDLWTKLSLELA